MEIIMKLPNDIFTLQKAFGEHELRVAGGAVRDMIMGIQPKDWDLCTTATPDEMFEIAKRNNLRVIPTGVKHGTITFNLKGQMYEITTLRIDVECDGRHAIVEFTNDWEADAARRDLTINSMMMKLDGTIVDPFGGQEDVKNELIRFVGEPMKRIQEDHLRILRFFRFASKFKNPKFDKNSLEAIKNNKDGIKFVSVERIWSELRQIFKSKSASFIFDTMNENGTLYTLGLPYKNIDNAFSPSVVIAHIFDNKKLLNLFIDSMKMCNNEKKVINYIFDRKHDKVDQRYFNVEIIKNGIHPGTIEKFAKYMHVKFDKNSIPRFIVQGDDLIKSGHKPGPEFKSMLDAMKDKWIESEFTMTKEELLNGVMK